MNVKPYPKRDEQEIERNMDDFFKAEKIADKAILKKLDISNFRPENYSRFKRYMLNLKEHYKNSSACLTDSVCDVTPLELKLLGDDDPFDYVYLDDSEDSKCFVNSDVMNLIIETRKYPNQEKAYSILKKYSRTAKLFPKIYFANEYIDAFESYLDYLFRELEFAAVDIDYLFFKFHPIFIPFIREHLDLVFHEGSFGEDKKPQVNFLYLSDAGKDLLYLSQSVEMKIM